MKRTQLSIVAVVTALTVAGVVAGAGSMLAQQPACLHGQNEATDQRDRRQQALRLTRQVNSLEAAARGRTQAYQPFAALANVSAVPAGFELHMATDGVSYALSVKDTIDPCHFAYFSDHEGMIYTGQPIQ